MKQGTENRKKMIAAGGLGTAALLCLIYAYNQLFGGPTNPAASAPASSTTSTAAATPATTSPARRNNSAADATAPSVVIPGTAARRLAVSSAALDPTLDQTAMLRTENLVYSGAGRNIFSATYTPPAPAVPKNIPPARPVQQHPVYVPPVQTGPPPPPPINLKFFGTAVRSGGQRQAFLLSGEDVYVASAGEIVARKYKIGAIGSSSLQVTDLQNNNTQTLPLQQ